MNASTPSLSTSGDKSDSALIALESRISDLNQILLELRNILLCWAVISIFVAFVSLYMLYVFPTQRGARGEPKPQDGDVCV